MAEAVRAENLCVYYGARCALDAVNFETGRAGMTAVLGPNGAGKTSLLKALAGLVPYAGTVYLGEENAKELTVSERAKRLAYVPQRSSLSAALSVRSVVLQGRYCHRSGISRFTDRDRRAVDHALKATDTEALSDRAFTELSGGEQRRVLLARALATEARTILLDEPTSFLDPGHCLTLFSSLQRLSEAAFNVLMVLHDLTDAERFCDRVMLLHEGRLVAEGAPRAVISEPMVRDIYGVRLIRGGGHSFEELT